MTTKGKIFLFGSAAMLLLSIMLKLTMGNVLANAGSVSATPAAPLVVPSLKEIGIELIEISTLPTDQAETLRRSAILEELAVTTAAGYSAIPPEQATTIVAKLYLFSDDQHGPIDAHGVVKPLYQKRLVWLVTYTGLVYPRGRLRGSTWENTPNTEFNVVIDAVTGEFLQGFTYR